MWYMEEAEPCCDNCAHAETSGMFLIRCGVTGLDISNTSKDFVLKKDCPKKELRAKRLEWFELQCTDDQKGYVKSDTPIGVYRIIVNTDGTCEAKDPCTWKVSTVDDLDKAKAHCQQLFDEVFEKMIDK